MPIISIEFRRGEGWGFVAVINGEEWWIDSSESTCKALAKEVCLPVTYAE